MDVRIKLQRMTLFVRSPEKMCAFYTAHFGARALGAFSDNVTKDVGVRLRFPAGMELQLAEDFRKEVPAGGNHLTFLLETREQVNVLTLELCDAACEVVFGPFETKRNGYASCVLDPEGNYIEIMAE